MKTELHRRTANELQLLEDDARAKRARYSNGSQLYSYFDGAVHAYRDLRLQVLNGDFSPLDDVPDPAPASWQGGRS